MKKLPRTALPVLLLLTSAASAVEIEVGGRTLEIPLPSGYAELTPEMSPTYEAMYAYVLPSNERHLILVPSEDADALLRGKEVDIGRYMIVESEKQSSRFDLTQGDFDELRDTMRSQIDEMWESARQDLPGIFDDASESMSDTLDADIEMSIGDIIPMAVHLDTDDMFGFSQLINIGVALEGEDLGSEVMMTTVAVTRVRGKLIFVMIYGFEDDLDWTREQATDWANQILAANPDDEPAASVTRVGTFGDTAYEHATEDDESPLPLLPIIAIAVGVLGLIVVLSAAKRRREG